MLDDQKDGYFVFTAVSRTADSSDGSGYREMKYVGHTYGNSPEEYLQMARGDDPVSRPREYIFFKISDGIRLKPTYRTIPAKTELVEIEKVENPITDLRWME